MKTVFMGTPEFAVPVLDAIISAGHDVGYVVTQPDKAKNRGKKIVFSPVKQLALEKGIEILQPDKIKESRDTLNLIMEYQPDIIVVVAYGQILSKEILDMPKYGCINVHASLLPKLRGASPIQHAILSGDKKTGVTIMQMAEGLDTGDMLTKTEVEINKMNFEQLHDTLAEAGAGLLVETLNLIEEDAITPEKQDDEVSTYAGLISKQDGRIDFNREPEEIERQIRAFDPWPGAFCNYNGETLKIWKAECINTKTDLDKGTITDVSDKGIDIVCGNGILRALEIQVPGKKRVEIGSFLRGNRIEKGTLLR